MVTCGKTPTSVTRSEHLRIYCRVIVTQQRPTVEHSLVSHPSSAVKGADCNLIIACLHGRNLVGHTRDVSLHFFRRGYIIFFSFGFVFGEVSNIKVMFVTFCVKSVSC